MIVVGKAEGKGVRTESRCEPYKHPKKGRSLNDTRAQHFEISTLRSRSQKPSTRLLLCLPARFAPSSAMPYPFTLAVRIHVGNVT